MAKSISSVASGQSKPADKPVIREIRAEQASVAKIPAPISAPPPRSGGQPASTIAPPTPPPIPTPPQQPLLFEVGWEVCWQLGGIYTVLRSKAAAMQKKWEDRYFLIGPYNPNTAAIEFEERPTEGFIRQTLDKLRESGMPCHFGNWLVARRPKVILLDHRARYSSLDNDKYWLWKDHGISTVASDGEVNDVVAFGFAVAEFFKHLTQIQTGRRVLAHFQEWMGGVAVPRIAHLRYPVTTVFTTHATLLGRYLASDDPDFYSHLPHVDPDAAAAHYNIYPRFAIERAAAHASTVFTTVSEVTATEAGKLLGREPDAILPNGLSINRFQAIHELQTLHRQFKEQIHEFVMGHFFPSYTFDLDRTLYLFTSGRYEYRNKGMDLFIESLARLNQRLKTIPDRPTIVTHDLIDDANDPILKHFRHRGLFNAADDPVKVVFHPEFVTATSPLLNLDYEQFVLGCHMGVFPSYYEPWGYTPMECAALGVPSVTTDLSGFGAYCQHHIPNSAENGIYVLKRLRRSFDDSASDLANHLFQFSTQNRRQRIEIRNKVEQLSELFDWSMLVQHYNEAHELAMSRTTPREGKIDVRVV